MLRIGSSLSYPPTSLVIVMRRSIRWHLKHLVHNCIAHPLLPLAEALEDLRICAPADVIFRFHDMTSPKDDPFNRNKYLS